MVKKFFQKRFIFVAIIVIILDQITKHIVQSTFTLGESILILPGFFSFTFLTNTGASFGILKGMNFFLIVVGIVIVSLLYYYMVKEHKHDKKTHPYFGLIVGGAISNLIDRVLFGSVIDFIHFHFWPTFNIADSAITIGALLLLFFYLRKE